ncbi:class I SAM-dependent methyltransferase [Paenibacillus sp. XY044]|uniref:tRNA (adenine(22)-N(1))-methyltransferase n=1 Tax=Paenibacillus sp. XY044 TaxID=2026089 RepID=UPI000B97FD6E|nr:class I SAM-dependent methyltransferase [Paenibacillus sp. XY044]OZB91692.1 tRNA (adenine-N(1))-methyltransferase [Paenibacillus sp. XY044]
MKLSRRLQLIMEQIPPGSRLADIGSDHALLPVAAVQAGLVVKAVAGEVNQGPLQAAAKQVAEAGRGDDISVRLGDGLAVISPGEVDVITIAGMGGSLIASILNEGQDKLSEVKRLILQPNVGEDLLRRWLIDHAWVLVSELIIEEDGKIYEILTAVPENSSPVRSNEELYLERTWQTGEAGDVVSLSKDLLIRMGPWLLEQPSEVFIAKWEGELAKMEGILKSVSSSQLASAEAKARELNEEMKQIREVLACLQKDKR